jgi:3-dehydroquinate synthase
MTSPSTRSGAAPLRVGAHPIDLRLRPGALADLLTVLDMQGIVRPLIVADDALLQLLDAQVGSILRRVNATVVPMRVSEADKTLHRVAWLAERGADADGVVAIGGGTVGNLAGAAAHLLSFGRPLVQVPSTVAAMVDAAISARHGLNTASNKNGIGVHHPPAAVLVDPLLLASLPAGAWKDGAIEAVKAALIGGGPDAERLARTFATLSRPVSDVDLVAGLLADAIHLKARLIADDPHETGPGMALHYGHTLARAVETHSGYAIRHGPAVSAGMLLAARVAETLGLLTAEQRQRHDACTRAACPPAPVETRDVDALVGLMAADPKRTATSEPQLPLVLPAGLGAAHRPTGAAAPVTAVERKVVADALLLSRVRYEAARASEAAVG